MTQSNPLHTEKISIDSSDLKRMFWGTIALDIIAMLVFGYFVIFMLKLDKTPIVYVGIVIFLSTFLSAVASTVLTIRGHQKLGAELVLYSLSALGVTMAAVFQGRTPTSSLSILTISVIVILYLLPSRSRRWYLSASIMSFIMMWMIEWINPAWRIQLAAATIGPIAVIVFAVILGVMIFLQARKVIANRFLSLSLRAKLLISIVGITGLALLVYGVIFLYRTQQSQAFWSSELQSTVQQQSQQQILASARLEADTADQSLSQVTLAVQQLADYHAGLFTSQSLLGQGEYWDGNSKLERLSDGQYRNAATDLATIFIPNLVSLSPSIVADVNTSMYLDFSAPKILEENPNIVAVYYDSVDNYTVYYPNINLADLVPPDFDPSAQSFYTVATPQNNPEHKPVWTVPYQDPAGTGLIVTNSVPVYDQNNRFRGVMSADIQLSKITEQLSAVKVGQSGFAFLIDPGGHIIAMPDAGYELFGLQPEVVPVNESPKTTILGLGSVDFQNITQKMVNGEQGLATAAIQDTPYYIAYYPLPTIGYSIGLIAPTSELDAAYLTAREQINQQTQSTTLLSILILLVVLLAVGGISLLLGRFLATPLTQLTETAMEVSKGNLNIRAEVQTQDEIGTLASTFNIMTGRLQEILGTLEQRIAARTRNLELAAEVGRAVSQVRNLDVMLKDACELILKEFNLYYVQVYLADPSQTNLVLEAGTGDVGVQLLARGHKLQFNTGSINGRAAVEKRSVVIADTAQSATFRPNKLLPATRGEMAVPLIVGDKVVGVLDMQSSEPDVLTDETIPAFEALAGQMAVAVQNANLLEETEQARAQVESQARRLVREGWTEHLDAIHKPEKLGFVFDHNQISPLAEVDETQLPVDGKSVSAPIAVTGEALGSLVVEVDAETRAGQTSELVNIVARQVAQQIENLRLLESAERYRAESERAANLQTIEGWQRYVASRTGESLGYLYDTKEVHPQSNEHVDTSMFTLPIKARDEKIGKLAIQGLTNQEQESVDLVNAVAERLSAHIESLRLFEETRQGQVELDKRARQLAAVAEISNVSSKELDIQKMLESVVHLTQRKFGLYHAHVFIYDETTDELRIRACGYKEGDEHEGTHGTAAIPMTQEQSLVGRAARTRKAVIVNNVFAEAGWLPNPLLPDTASELAVPLVVGDRVLGVLDVQSERVNAFTDEDANIQMTLASQVATALQNARSFTQAQKQANREAMLNTINQKIQSATSVEAVLQIAARELGHALGAPMTIAQLSMKETSS